MKGKITSKGSIPALPLLRAMAAVGDKLRRPDGIAPMALLANAVARRTTGSASSRRRSGGLAVVLAMVGAMALGGGTATAAPSCPEGSTYNKATKQCERAPKVVCPTDSSYDPATGLCRGEPTPVCDERASYNPETGECEYPACEAGETYHPETQGCIGLFLGRPATCDEGYTLDEASGQCTKPPSATCSSGLSYDAGEDACIAVPGFACPQGYGYNATTGKCQTAPTKGNTKR